MILCRGLRLPLFRAVNARERAHEAGVTAKIAGTRKTTPGFRLVEKYALEVGGVDTHRYDLSSMIMLKDNHLDVAKDWDMDLQERVLHAKHLAGFTRKVEVECRSLAEALTAAQAGADIVMLDNWGPEEVRRQAAVIKTRFPMVLIEVSGGVTPDNIGAYGGIDNIDIISMGCLTQDIKHVDFSMRIITKNDREQRSSIV